MFHFSSVFRELYQRAGPGRDEHRDHPQHPLQVLPRVVLQLLQEHRRRDGGGHVRDTRCKSVDHIRAQGTVLTKTDNYVHEAFSFL